MVPAWKIRRELNRIAQQLRGFGELLTDPIKQRRLDRLVAAGLPCIEGTMPLTDRVALLLIYQPDGVAGSILETCRWFSDAGWAPFVVSNTPISTEDQNRLAGVTWRVVTRPNFGYDFGGYRDGLTCLRQWGIDPEELIILNDSIWLPIVSDTDFFERLDTHPAEIAGTILRARGDQPLLESYFYRLRRSALEHPAFHKFWSTLRLTSNKFYTIRRGEKGFSAAMLKTGLKVDGVYPNDSNLIDIIAKKDDLFLRHTLEYAAYIDPDFKNERDDLLQIEIERAWRDKVLAHMYKVAKRRQAYRSFPYAMIKISGLPILKRSADRASGEWRRAYLRASDAGNILPPPL